MELRKETIIFEALRDPLVKYLKPYVITKYIDIVCDADDDVSDLLAQVKEDSTEKPEVLRQFMQAFAKSQNDGNENFLKEASLDSGRDVSSYCVDFVKLTSNQLLPSLNSEILSEVLQKLEENKIISQKSRQELQKKADDNDLEDIFLQILKNVKKGKPNWPFIFFDILKPPSPKLDMSRFVEALLKSLHDTFLMYLMPKVITKYMDGDFGSEEDASDFLDRVWEGDSEDTRLVDKFSQAFGDWLKDSSPDRKAFLQGQRPSGDSVSGYCTLLAKLIEGSLLTHLSPAAIGDALQSLKESKMILPKFAEELKTKSFNTSTGDVCTDLFGKIKESKPEWPFVFLNAIDATVPVPAPMLDQVGDPESPETGFSEFMDFDKMDDHKFFKSTNIDTYEMFYRRGNQQLHLSPESRDNPVVSHLIQNESMNKDLVMFDGGPIHDSKYYEGYPSDAEEDEIEALKSARKACEKPPLNLRKYQDELSERAVRGDNTIICAPTGCGKTRVATHIIHEHLEENRGRKVAFLARTVPLVIQQSSGLKKYLSDWKITSITGESEYSMALHMMMDQYDVIVMTPKILENHLLRKYLPNLGVFSLIIFDECHHTREGEPYNTLMMSYLKTKREGGVKLPQIIGLTASISVEDAKNVDEAVESILKVCGNLDCDNISAVEKHIEELKQVVPVPREESFQLREREKDDIVKAIEKIMGKLERQIENHVKDLRENKDTAEIKIDQKPTPNKKSQQYNQWTVALRNDARKVPLSREGKETNIAVRSLIIICSYLVDYNVALETYDLVRLEDVMVYLKKQFSQHKANEKRCRGEDIYFKYFEELESSVKSKTNMNGNLEQLGGLIQKYLIQPGNDNACGIIFVKTRAMTQALCNWLSTHRQKAMVDLKAEPFTGSGASAEEGGMTQSDQDAATQRFKSGQTRLLISTSVAEEGLDIPECNLVIKYNHVGNEVTTVQTRGRSRKKGGVSVLLAMDKIFQKECINKYKTKLMTQAIDKIRKMPTKQLREKVNKYQNKILKEAEIEEMLKARDQDALKDVKFDMVCRLCRKVKIKSQDIKLINESHRVNVDRNLLDTIQVWPYGKSRPVDDMRLLGSVRCKGEPEEGKYCFQHLGSLMVYKATYFVVLTITSFGFDVGQEKLQFFRRWKDAHFKLDHIDIEDITRYLPERTSQPDSGFKDDDDITPSDADSHEASQEADAAVPSVTSMMTGMSVNDGKNEDGKKDSAKPSTAEFRDSNSDTVSTSSSTDVKRVFGTRTEKDSGLGSVRSEGSSFDSTQLKIPVAVVSPLHSKEDQVCTTATESERPTIVSTQRPHAPESFQSGDSQTDVLSQGQAERSRKRIEDEKFKNQALRALHQAPTLSSVGTSIGDPSELDDISNAGSRSTGTEDMKMEDLLISK